MAGGWKEGREEEEEEERESERKMYDDVWKRLVGPVCDAEQREGGGCIS